MEEIKLLRLLDDNPVGLTESDLRDILGMSDSDLKEILNKLTVNGLITSKNGRYTFTNERYHLGRINNNMKLITKNKQAVSLDYGMCAPNDYVIYTTKEKKNLKYKIVYVIPKNINKLGIITNIDDTNYLIVNNTKYIVNDKRVTNETIVEYKIENNEVEIISVLGYKDEPSTIMKMLAIEFGIDTEYPKEVEEEVKNISMEVTENDLVGRVDLRSDATVTIDSIDTNDIDDAIYYVGKNKNNHDIVRISIADVTHHVPKNSASDIYARQTTTSVYTPDGGAYHMFHPKYSKGICSLNPNVDRLARTYEIAFDERGNIVMEESKTYLSVINSKKKIDKNSVNKIFDGETLEEFESYKENLFNLLQVSKAIRHRRIRNGLVDFDSFDRKFDIEKNDVKGIKNCQSTLASDMIEDFMLSTGEFQARLFEENGIKGIFRVEEPPVVEKVDEVIDALELHHIHVKKKNDYCSKDIQDMLHKIKAKNLKIYPVFRERLIRSMTKAKYSTTNIGHLGLALQCYAQCTSPIRRFGDDVNHELDAKYIDNSNRQPYNEVIKMEALAGHLTKEENRAKKFEREADRYYIAKYMEKFIGESFEAQIFDIKKDGIEILLSNLTEGFLRFCDSKAKFDTKTPNQIKITSLNGSAILRIGDSLGVTLVESDVITRKVYYKLDEKVLIKKI